MKRAIYLAVIFLTLLFFSGCEKSEMISYGEGGEINLMGDYYGGKNKKPYWVDEAEYLKNEENFGLNKLGEALLADTVLVGVKIMGTMSKEPRKVVFKTNVPEQNGLEVIFPEEYYVPADTGVAIFKIVVKRPATRNVIYTADLIFDYARSDFKPGTKERQIFKLKAEDTVSLKLWGTDQEEWDSYYVMFFGAYSETKVRYLITKYGAASFPVWTASNDFYEVAYSNGFYTDFEEYRSNPANPPLLDDEGEWISIPDISELF